MGISRVSKLTWVASAIAVCALVQPAPGTPRPAIDAGQPAVDLTIADLKWPDTTQSIQTKGSTEVRDAARKGERIGKIEKGKRLAWKRIVATRDRCKSWLEIEPRGWVCARDVKPSNDPPTPAALADRPALPAYKRFADVRGAAVDAYSNSSEIKAGTPSRQVHGKTFVVVGKSTKVNGVKYHRTDKGYIKSDRLRWLSPSDFEGVDVSTVEPPGWPFAWVIPRKLGGKTAQVYGSASKKASKVRELARRELVPVHEIKGKFARVGEAEWVKVEDLRVVEIAARPDGVGDQERWIDVNLDQQTLVAYEGDTPVFVTLVSTGKKTHGTPVGIHRITKKYEKTRMRNPKASRDVWDVAEVPFAMKFRKNFALHGAYWHDGFGKVRSHGCVNLSPRDAQRMYWWTTPDVPEGWASSEVEDGAGTVIRIRNKRTPNPPWKTFDGKKIKAKKKKPATTELASQ